MEIDKMNKILFIILLFILSFSFTGEIYRVYVDREFGFWAVRSHDINQTVNYNSRTLNIQTGDAVEWENADYTGNRITIISDNLLWEGGKSLGAGSLFSFTFNSSNIYRFHIAEQSRFEAKTTEENISVYDEDEDIWTNTTAIKPYEITYFRPQYQTIVVTGQQVGNGTNPIKRSIPILTYTRNTPAAITDGEETTLSDTEIEIKYAASTQATKPTVTIIPMPVSTPELMESYQEFTLYEIMKKWYTIINAS